MRIFLLILVVAILPLNAHATAIKGVRIGAHQEKTRVVFDLTNKLDFKSFSLSNPSRVVVDLPAIDWQAGSEKMAGGDILGMYHAQRADGSTRIVINMARPTRIVTSFFLPAAGGKPNRLVLDLAPSGAVAGNTNISTITVAKPIPKQKPAHRKKYVVVLDAGHGGRDPGAMSGKVLEKNITFSIVKELKKQLESDGRYKVFLTRPNDKRISLGGRVSIARKHKADLFISIHADSIDNSSVRGASIYTLSETSSDRQTAKLAAKENQADIIAGLDLSTQDKQVTSILIDLSQRDSMNKAGFIAETLVSKLKSSSVRTLENPHRFAGFAVLKAPDVPSILIEAGFLSNSKEVRELSKPSYQKKLSIAIKRGVDDYFDRLKVARRQ